MFASFSKTRDAFNEIKYRWLWTGVCLSVCVCIGQYRTHLGLISCVEHRKCTFNIQTTGINGLITVDCMLSVSRRPLPLRCRLHMRHYSVECVIKYLLAIVLYFLFHSSESFRLSVLIDKLNSYRTASASSKLKLRLMDALSMLPVSVSRGPNMLTNTIGNCV